MHEIRAENGVVTLNLGGGTRYNTRQKGRGLSTAQQIVRIRKSYLKKGGGLIFFRVPKVSRCDRPE